VTVSTPQADAAVTPSAPSVKALRRSPLSDLAADFEAATVAGPRGVRLREIPFLAQVNLRVDPTDRPSLRRIAAAFGEELPTTPNTVATAGIRQLLWLGPDEWLVIGPDSDARWIERALRSALGEPDPGATGFGSVVNVSAGRTILELSGPAAREVLEKGCALDLHPLAFRPGQCAQTLVSRAEVILHQTSDTPTYRLLVRTSFARYLAFWLLDAMQEFRYGGLEDLAQRGLEELG
jgi:sarcosine oxidase subunit gamma